MHAYLYPHGNALHGHVYVESGVWVKIRVPGYTKPRYTNTTADASAAAAAAAALVAPLLRYSWSVHVEWAAKWRQEITVRTVWFRKDKNTQARTKLAMPVN